MPHEKKPGWEAYHKGHDKCCDVRFEGKKSDMEHVLVQDKIITDEKSKDIQEGIGATAGCVAESLYGHQLSEGRVEKVNKRNDLLFWHKIR
jgi:hypothetical protein